MKSRTGLSSRYLRSTRDSSSAFDNLKKLLDSSLDVICSIDQEGRFIEVNAASVNLWGYTPEELQGKYCIDYVIEQDKDITKSAGTQIRSGRDMTNFENRYRHKNGTIVPILWSARWDEEESVMYCVAKDSSEKIRADMLLRESQQNAELYASTLQGIIENVGDGFYFMDRDFTVGFWNKKAEHFLNKSKDDVIGRVIWEIFPAMKTLSFYEQFSKALRENIAVHFEEYVAQHSTWLDVSAYPSEFGLSVFFRSINEKKNREEELRISNERYDIATKATSDVLWDWDFETDSCYFNDVFTDMFGYGNKRDYLYKNWVDNIHPDDREWVFSSVQRAIQDKSINQWKEAYRFRKENGSIAYVLDRGFIIRNNQGKAVRMVGSMQDITERKMAEEERKLSEQKYRLLFHESRVAKFIYRLDDLSIIEVNQAAVDLYGYTKEEFSSLTLLDLKFPKDIASTKRFIEALRKQDTYFFTSKVRHRHKSGSELSIETTTQEISLTGRKLILASCNDVTEKVRLEQMIVEEKVNAQKEVAKAIIDTQEKERSEIGKELHDNVNQVLTTIKLYIENVKSYPEHSQEFLDKSVMLTQRAINEIRALAKQLVTPVMKDLGFEATIHELIDHYYSLSLFKLDFSFELAEAELEKGLKLTIYRIIQEQLNNIVKYAKATKVSIRIWQEKYTLKVFIEDDGVGFDTQSNTDGLGLNNIKNRAEIYKGKITLSSSPGMGCRLSVCFPLTNGFTILPYEKNKSQLL